METEWEQESFVQELGESFPESWEWGEAEYFPEARARRRAAARRLLPSRSLTPARPTSRPVPATMNAVRGLEERQRTTAAQLAGMQQRTATQQSSETFGPILTSAAAALTLGIKEKSILPPLLTHGVPLSQLLLISRGRSVGAAFRANPWATVAFPVSAVLLALFGERLIGGTPKDPSPMFISDGYGSVTIYLDIPQGVTVYWTNSPSNVPADPSPTSGEIFTSGKSVRQNTQVKFVAYKGSAKSTVIHRIAK